MGGWGINQTQTPCGFLAVGTAFSRALGLPIILRAVPPPFFDDGPAKVWLGLDVNREN